MAKPTLSKAKQIPVKPNDIETYLEYERCQINISVGGIRYFSRRLEVGDSEISCGVAEVSNLPMASDFTKLITKLGEKAAFDLVTEAFIEAFEKIKKGDDDKDMSKRAFIILSNNLLARSTYTNIVLSRICAETEQRKNPNSGSQIKIWIY